MKMVGKLEEISKRMKTRKEHSLRALKKVDASNLQTTFRLDFLSELPGLQAAGSKSFLNDFNKVKISACRSVGAAIWL